MPEKERGRKVYALLRKHHTDAKIALNFTTPFELLIATILSAQCTDARVNIVTPDLFRKYPTPKDFATAAKSELEQDIRSTGFFRQKAKSIINCSTSLIERFDGEVPRTMEELLTLDGVGRKTANVLLGNAFGVPGIAVDTHVSRLVQRLGFSKQSDPTKIEVDLAAVFPKKNWTMLCHLLISHGRKVCLARNPKCDICVTNELCPSAFAVESQKHAAKETSRRIKSPAVGG